MTKNLLVELGLEELPAYVVTPSEKQYPRLSVVGTVQCKDHSFRRKNGKSL